VAGVLGLAGALLVAPADVERADTPELIRCFAPIPIQPLPFRSLLVASSNDEYLSMDRAEHFARRWGRAGARRRRRLRPLARG